MTCLINSLQESRQSLKIPREIKFQGINILNLDFHSCISFFGDEIFACEQCSTVVLIYIAQTCFGYQWLIHRLENFYCRRLLGIHISIQSNLFFSIFFSIKPIEQKKTIAFRKYCNTSRDYIRLSKSLHTCT